MTKSSKDIRSYVFKPADELLLDTNVWFFIYGPQKPGDRRVAIYSRALKNMLEAKSRIYIDVLIVSEFVNAYARQKYHYVCSSDLPRPSFKQFRKRAAFKPIAQGIAAAVKRILQHCNRIASGFDMLDIATLVDEYEKGNSDFNDQVLTELCKSKGLTLVTDDADFANAGLTVVTANRRLLI